MFSDSQDSFLRRRQRQRHTQQANSSGHHRSRPTDSSSPQSRQRRRGQQRDQMLLLLLSFTGLAIWYWTPVSELLTSVLLRHVPLEADIALGRQAKRSFPYPTIRHPTWSPLVAQVGQELVSALAAVDDPQRILGDDNNSGDYASWLQDIVLAAVTSDDATSAANKNLADRYQWDFGVVRAPLVNAFALPGGVIRVTDQLLEQLSPTRGELAALLGHEIGHVLHRHSQARILQERLLQKIVAALTYEDHDDQDETFGQALGEVLLQSANWFGQQKFSRANEYQADAAGWNLLLEAQPYNPQAVKSLLEKLWALEGRSTTGTKGGGPALAWTSSHPATEDRIEALERRWQQLSKNQRRRLQRRTL